MPFAPIVMEEFFDEIFIGNKSKYSAEFMTICYSTKEQWIEKIPAVIQKSDKTARPQLVKKDNSPKFWEILNEYNKLSNIPVLLNTSFNSHNQPIIDNPEDAFYSLESNIIDKLVIGNYVYTNK
jgi:carbamoyltransferase